jgi:hypothetical protein
MALPEQARRARWALVLAHEIGIIFYARAFRLTALSPS